MWAYDFVATRTHDGRGVRLLTIVDEYTRECLAIRAERRIRSSDVIETLTELMTARGVPEHIRSDNGPEFTARAIRDWLADVGAKTLYIEPGSPWENGYIESFNGKLRDELLDAEVFYTMTEVLVPLTAIMFPGHFRPSLTPNGVGSDAFDLICRPDPGMAHSGLKALASSDLIGAWFHAPSQSCPLAWPARHRSGGKYERSRRPTR